MNGREDRYITVAKVLLGELDHFHDRYNPRRLDSPAQFDNSEHRDAVVTTRGFYEFLRNEPFVAYALIKKPDGTEMCLLICRHYAPPPYMRPQDPKIQYASYHSPMGQMIVLEAGEERNSCKLEEKATFLPEHNPQEKEMWDVRPFFFRADGLPPKDIHTFLRAVLRQEQRQGQPKAVPVHRRAFRKTVQLPAQAIVDAIQDEIFRLPMNRFVRISGGPGTGKTTVLIKRLSMKTKRAFLTENEKRLLDNSGVSEERQWVLFSPSDLLKSYLKEALAKELIAASDEHVKVYSTFRRETLRDIGFLRVGSHGYFRMQGEDKGDLLQDEGPQQLLALTKSFSEFFKEKTADVCPDAMLKFSETVREPSDALAREIKKLETMEETFIKLAKEKSQSAENLRVQFSPYDSFNQSLKEKMELIRGVIKTGPVYCRSLEDVLAYSQKMETFSKDLALNPNDRDLKSQFKTILELIDSLQAEAKTAAEEFAKFFDEKKVVIGAEVTQKYLKRIDENREKLADSEDLKMLNRLVDDFQTKINEDANQANNQQDRARRYRSFSQLLQDKKDLVTAVVETTPVRFSSLRDILEQAQKLEKLSGTLTLPDDTGSKDLFPTIPPLIEKLQKAAQAAADVMSTARMFRAIPTIYDDFRKQPEIAATFFVEDHKAAFKNRDISEVETDILLFHALDFVHELPTLAVPGNDANEGDRLQKLLGRLRLLVMIDEAADFSPLEIACMERLALPRYGGVTVSGDLMQRVTKRGLRSWKDMSTVCQVYEAKNLVVGYRQTARLFSIAKTLCQHVTKNAGDFRSAHEQDRDTDPPALAFKNTREKPVEEWLVDRICEIFALSGDHLPTTAILVPTAADVAPLRDRLLPRIQENSLELEASQEGHALGDTARVRIFPVSCIKGLEFEAVFYVGLDRMEAVHQELLNSYVYVGLSRARSFLGVTYETRFPRQLQCIESHFEHDGTWKMPETDEMNSEEEAAV